MRLWMRVRLLRLFPRLRWRLLKRRLAQGGHWGWFMTIRGLVRAIGRFRLIVCRRIFGRSGFGLVREQGRDGGLEIVGPYRVPDVCWGVEVEGYGDVDYLLVGEEGKVCPFESDGLGIIWKDWKGVQ